MGSRWGRQRHPGGLPPRLGREVGQCSHGSALAVLCTLPVYLEAPSLPLSGCLLRCPSQRGLANHLATVPQPRSTCLIFLQTNASDHDTVFYTSLSAP